ncbi:uncharacterized protein LOC143445960 [Clavelina lepadiformis]|uniref:PX domain-containing protein n=1 Tax=Clavelina lepadiformis TaxID=159417 RepID=A0ABP0FGY2_CLALP
MAFSKRIGVKATRIIKNNETGMDLTISDYRLPTKSESKSVLYRLVIIMKMVASDTSDSTEDEIVHFTKEKSYNDFLKLRKDLDKRYCGTYVPELAKKTLLEISIGKSELSLHSKYRERQLLLDKFVQWCASTTKIAKSEQLQEFLEVKKANSSGKSTDTDRISPKNETKGIWDKVQKERKQAVIPQENLFHEINFGADFEGQIFEGSSTTTENSRLPAHADIPYEVPLTGAKKPNTAAGLFEKPDLMGTISVGEKELIVLSDEEDYTDKNIFDEDEVEDQQDDLLDVTEDISSISSRLRKIDTKKVTPCERNPKTSAQEVKPTVDVNKMADEDVLTYVTENSTLSEELDLGF